MMRLIVRATRVVPHPRSALKKWARRLAVQIPLCGLQVAARVKLVFHGGDCARNAVN